MTALTRAWDSLNRHVGHHDSQAKAPVVIVGTGPVGMATARELLRRNRDGAVVMYGNEPWEPYNRVRLSSLLAGQLGVPALMYGLNSPHVAQHHNRPIVAIDRESHTVTDASGGVQPYSKLVLATGSRPHVPNIPGVDIPGVFRFRNMDDAQKLLARQTRSRRTVVLGGGLLGLEAAKAMQRAHTEVYVIDHSQRLMHHQLDEEASELLREHVLALGIHVVLGKRVQAINGEFGVENVQLAGGKTLACDTVVIAAGIRPNTQLALGAGLAVGRAIKVNDRMQTSDPDIYAVGECAEHRGVLYGLVAPGLEQAAVAAHNIGGGSAVYRGSVAATRLKVLGSSVFSMGIVGDAELPGVHQTREFVRRTEGIYRKLVLHRGRLVGAIALGDWSQTNPVQEAVNERRRMWPWPLLRFRRTGLLWADHATTGVASWPASAAVCTCTGVTRGRLSEVRAQGCDTVEALAEATGASTVCGSCRPLLAQLIGASPAATKGAGVLLAVSAVSLVATMLGVFSAPLPYGDSVRNFRLDTLWLDSVWKQVSGFTLLGLSLFALAMSLRKRWPRLAISDFALWRHVHVVLGASTLAVLTLHTGLHFGRNLNLALMVAFTAVVLLGALAGGFAAIEHKLLADFASRLRNTSRWLHIAACWPLPVLLAFHITAAYYF